MRAENRSPSRLNDAPDLACRWRSGKVWIDLHHAGDVVISENALVQLRRHTERNHDGRNHGGMIQAEQVSDLMSEDTLNVELVGFGTGRKIQCRIETDIGLVEYELAILSLKKRERGGDDR